MAVCNIEGVLKLVEQLYQKSGKDSDAGKVLKALGEDINYRRAVIQQASSFAGSARININKPFEVVDYTPTPAPVTTPETKVKSRKFGDVTAYFYPKGSKILKGALAFTRNDENGNAYIVMQEGITKKQVISYLRGKDGSKTSVQKSVVNEFMLDVYGVDLIGELNKLNDADIRKFIIKHELSHIRNADNADVYYANKEQTIATAFGKANRENNYLADSAIKIETRANLEALALSLTELTTPDYLSALKLLDEYLPNKIKEESSNFDEELNAVLTEKLTKLYPEIELVLTEEEITESDNAKYQKTSLGVVTKGLKALYPAITDKDLDTVVKKYGEEQVNSAITAINNQVDGTNEAALPFQYSLLYLDLLDKTTYIQNAIKQAAKLYKVDSVQAKLKLADIMAMYVISKTHEISVTEVEKSIADKVWKSIIRIFNNVFSRKDMKEEKAKRIGETIAFRFWEGVNADGITLTPKKGTSKVDPSFDFTNQPFSAQLVEDVTKMSDNTSLFTGSEALAMQGTVYRKQGEKGTDLHDLDFTLPTKEAIVTVANKLMQKYSTVTAYSFYVPKNPEIGKFVEGAIKKVPMLKVLVPVGKAAIRNLPKNKILTLIVLPDKNQKIVNLKRFKGDSSRVVSYDIVDDKGTVVGTYKADVQKEKGSFRTKLLSESTTGVKAVLVDLIQDNVPKDSRVNWKSPNGVNVGIWNYKDIFKAKNNLSNYIPRDKDVVDFNSFYNPSFGPKTEEYQRSSDNQIKGKADLEAKKVFINTLLQTQDTLPHEFAHHYISWFKNTDIVKEAIKKWGSEEALVQAIGEQAVAQKGEAYSWWKKFTDWLRKTLDVSKADKETLKNVLTDAFLTRQDLNELKTITENSSTPDYKLPGGYSTNPGQTGAINTIINWYKERKSNTFLLQGRGGTGKTTVINVLLKELGVKPSQVIFAAPTNKAKKVLKKANSKTTYADSGYYTVAQLLGVIPKRDNRGNQVFKEDPFIDKPGLRQILVVDEASMLHSTNYEALIARAKKEGTRIIFMGDNAQLPPIGDPKASVRSVVFADNLDNTSTLTQLMRQEEDSPIIVMTDELIAEVNKTEKELLAGEDKNSVKAWLVKKVFDGAKLTKFDINTNEGVVLTDSPFEKIITAFLRDYKKSPKTTKYINFNNHMHPNTLQKNKMIREQLYGDKATEEMFISGEPLVLNSPYKYILLDDDTSLLDNGEEFTVVSSRKVSKNIKYQIGKRTVVSANPLEVYEIIATDNVTGQEITFDKPTGTKVDLDAFIEKEKAALVSKGKKPGGAYMLIDFLADGLSHGYIINSHKSQGSTYDNVYMDLGNIAGQPLSGANDIIKSLYVAASRPRKKLVVIDTRDGGNQLDSPSDVAVATPRPSAFDGIDNAELDDIIDNISKCKGK